MKENHPNTRFDDCHRIREVQAESIPLELFVYHQWVCWCYVERQPGKKPEKQPINPRTLHKAGVQWPNTWSDFATAYAALRAHGMQGIEGVGFVLTADDPYVAIDLDNCVQEDVIDDYATEIVEQFGSYAEISPSGHGIRILLHCADFQENARRAKVEIYSNTRYVTITGHHIAGTPGDIAAATAEQLRAIVPASSPPNAHSNSYKNEAHTYPTSDLELWERIFAHDKYGAQHLRRFQGDTSFDRGDHSFTVIRLLNCLARWTKGDANRMRAMMLLSPLANPKWFEKRGKGDWLDHQIADAIGYSGYKQGR